MVSYWTMDSWGSEYPPENAEEIIAAANEMIAAYAETHDDVETDNYSMRLWARYSATGKIKGGQNDEKTN